MKISPNYCLVTQRVIAITADSDSDADRLPDQQTVSGEIYFTPNVPGGRSYQLRDEEGKSYTVPLGRVEASIVDGEIVHEGERGISLFAAGQGSNPSKISYFVEYRNLRAGTTPINLSPMNFEAVPGGEVDLTTATPVTGATPPGTTKGDKGDVGPAATIVSHEALPGGDVQVEFSDGTIITVPAGETPYVKDGNWWIGEQDTGVVADGVDQVRDALAAQISTIESNAERAEVAAAGTESAISRNASKGQQMIVNGNGKLGGDYWDRYVTVVNDDVPLGAYASWEKPGAQAAVWHNSPVVIDTSSPLYMSSYFRQVTGDVNARVYLALVPVDQDGQSISAMNIMYVPGTLTKLARDLSPGDTKVYLESAENWVNTGTGESNKRFIIWNHVSKSGKAWEPETYSRNVSATAWEPGAIDYVENSVTLKTPWAREFLPAGTPLSNGNNGANYMYAGTSSGVGNSWVKIEGTVQGGLDLTGQGFATHRGWPPGVSAVLPGVLINYGVNQRESNHRFANAYLSQLSPLGHTHTTSEISDIEVNKETGGVTIAGIPVDGVGPQGPPGEPGPLTFEDFTPEQLETLKGEPGEVTLEQLNQAIRVDTTVGTRVFTGDTMIYGDTGWRDISGGIQSEWAGTAKIKRDMDRVSLMVTVRPVDSLVGTNRNLRRRLLQLPFGFYSTGHLAYQGSGEGDQNGMRIPIDMGYAINMLDIRNSSHDLGVWTSSIIKVSYTFRTDSGWPSSLPGTPL